MTAGSCPLAEEATTYIQSAVNLLLNDEPYSSEIDVATGSCRTFVLKILDSLGDVVDEQSVNVSNI